MKKSALFLILTCLATGAHAGYTEGETAFNEQRYNQAYAEFLPLADKGDFRSQYYIGYLYLNGYGIPQDTKKAVAYLEKSVDQNYDLAQALMGYLYNEGSIVRKNKRKAIDLYEKAAEQGNASALLNLGVAYYTGDGVEKNTKKALDYFSKVSPKEKPIVAKYIGDIYLNDKALADPNKAFVSYLTAAKAGDIGAYHVLGYMYQHGIGVNTNMQDALKFYLYAAAQNYAPSQYALGVIYANGDGGIPRDIYKAFAWLSLASEQDMPEALKAKQTLFDNMSLSDRDRANRAMIDIQQNDMKGAKSPIQDIVINQPVQQSRPAQGTVRRRRR